ncbi:MAG: VCBS repeat-containing protein, partial [Deltaproteobacteria bacterium]|nr:VCBS repeat-containing protein [Deltaproteobacteria bacterium]
HLLNDDNKFSISPDYTIYDTHGGWVSPYCTDINNDGILDFIKIETEIKTGLRKHQKSTISIFIAKKDGSYDNNPNQSFETTSLPLLHNLLVDIDGDELKDLILVDPITKGFSVGSIINKFLRKGIDANILVLPFNEGYSEKKMLKKVKMKFLKGIPINLEGDFNGDVKKDLLIIDEGTIKIFQLINLNKGFSRRPEFIIKIHNLNSYIVQDVNNNNKSDVIVFSGSEIKFILF